MSWVVVLAVGWLGWALAVAAGLTLRRRTALIADAEHELRGAVTALALLAGDRLTRLQVDRMTAALADLAQARGGAPPPPGQVAAGRLAQVLANVSANAAEHGIGRAQVRSERVGEVIRLEVSNREPPDGPQRPPRAGRGRGRGLHIAERAARELGGRVTLERVDGEIRAVIELPASEVERPAREAGRGAGEGRAGGAHRGSHDGGGERDDPRRAA